MKSNPSKEQIRQECNRVLEQLQAIHCIPVKSAAKLLHITPKKVREFLPVKVLGPKTHRVSMSDIDALLQQRTVTQ